MLQLVEMLISGETWLKSTAADNDHFKEEEEWLSHPRS